MSSDDQTVGQQQPPERPETRTTDDEIVAEREASQQRLSAISTEPGARYTENVEMLVIEAELAADGVALDNPAKIPDYADGTAEQFAERLEDTDLVPAWTRPWEGDE